MQDNLLVSVYDTEHFVQFYPDEKILIKNLLSFIGGGVASGDPCAVIATKKHINSMESGLIKCGLDIDKAKNAGRLKLLDAAETLDAFMRNGMPNKELFYKVIGSLLSELSQPGKTIRAFGEMVALLSEQGNYKGVIELEKLWNEIANDYHFTLFCAYPAHQAENLKQSQILENLDNVCKTHSRALLPQELVLTSVSQS